MKRYAFRTTLLILILLPLVAHAQEKRAIEPEDYYAVKRVSSTELSPDGRYLLYAVQTVRQEENDRLTEIWWTDLETGVNRRLSTAGINTTSPHWTPDGKRIYFTTTRGDERGLHFLNFLEPGGEAYRIPSIPNNPRFTPDGEWIVFTRRVAEVSEEEQAEPGEREEPGERGERSEREGVPQSRQRGSNPDGIPGLTRRMGTEWAGTNEEERNLDVYVITTSSYKRNGQLNFNTGSSGGGFSRGQFGGFGGQGGGDGRYTQFFRMPATGLAESEEAEQLTTDPWNKSFQGFSPDGRSIIYTVDLGQKEEREEIEDPRDRPPTHLGIFLLPIDGGEGRQIAEETGSLRGIAMSPDGSMLAYTLTVNREQPAVVRVITTSGEKVAEAGGEDWVYGFGSLTWTADSVCILTTSSIGGQSQVMRIVADTGAFEPITGGDQVLSGVTFDRAMSKMAYVKNSAEIPWEAYVARVDGSGEQRISDANTAWMDEVKLSRVERITFEGARHNEDWLDNLPKRGVEYMMTHEAPRGERPVIEGWLMYPLDYQEGTKYPLVLSIHGGPHSAYRNTWFPEFQMIAAEGIFVLYINPRGSGSYGRHFSSMIMESWGIDDYKDYMQAVDLVVDRGIVDETAMGVTGGSYGGFMTNWITAHNDRFKCAITARSICNWISFYGISDASGLVENEFGGRPWPFESEDEGSWIRAMMLSPIAWADQVVTPTLIIHSINDYRCPLAEAEQWFRALKKNEVPVKMVLFPDSTHDLSRTGEPWLLVRRLQEYVDWFGAYLVDDEPVVNATGPVRR